MFQHTAEIVLIKDKQYVLVDHYIAIRVDWLAEQYSRCFTEWREEHESRTIVTLPKD